MDAASMLGTLLREDWTVFPGMCSFEGSWRDNVRVVLNTVPDVCERKACASARVLELCGRRGVRRSSPAPRPA
jgi:hypothetical protein